MVGQFELLKKLKKLKAIGPSLGLLLLPVCLIFSLLYLNLEAVNKALSSRASFTWIRGGSPPPPPPPPPPQPLVSGLGAPEPSSSVEIGRQLRHPVGNQRKKGECDLFDGKWVWDEAYPLYDSRDCKLMDSGFRCSENGRPDHLFSKWRWQPNRCHLPRFNAKSMLERLRNRRLAFVGDSIGRNQWESLLCMLASAVPNKSSIYEVNNNPITKHMGSLVFRFQDYNCTIEYYRSPFLVVQGHPPREAPKKASMTIRVDQLDWSSSKWKDADVLVFNSGHWWNYEKTLKVGCYFQEGNEVKMNMSVQAAFQRSMETLMHWVDKEVNSNKTHVFFRSYAPVHFSAGDWRTGGSCHQNRQPDSTVPFTSETYSHFTTANKVLSRNSGGSKASRIHILNVTYMTALRKDGHPSVYYTEPKPAPLYRQDCSHWCLPGVPDTWNELLYASFVRLDSTHTNIWRKTS